ncbi:MAG TPA: dipeptidase [Rectinemataceae bacterium]
MLRLSGGSELRKNRHPVIDAHCDALLAVIGKSQIPGDSGKRDFLARNALSHVDLPKLLEGGVACQFMALFAEDADLPEIETYVHRLLDIFHSICASSDGRLFPILSSGDLETAIPGKRVGALLSIEGAEALGESLDPLETYFKRGVRAVGITWNRRNAFGRGVKAPGLDGLTRLGFELVEALEAKRMIVDVSHLSDAAFDDLCSSAKRPFIASHSNARSICEHPRNLTDSQIRMIADSGGAVGVVFVPSFVATMPSKSYLEHLLDHIDHIVKVGGLGCAAFGSDFDGYRGVEGHVIADASAWQELADALSSRGYGDSAVSQIMGGNWERVMKDILPP